MTQRLTQGSGATGSASFSAAHQARVLLVDDHPIVRQGLSLTLQDEPDLCVCGQAASAREALEAAAKLKPHIALVDLGLEGSHGIDLIKDFSLQFPGVRLLVLSMHDEKLYAERALRAGAHGYIMKKEPPDRVVEAIRRVLKGGIYCSEAITNHLLEMRQPRSRVQDNLPLQTLTDRELEILEYVGNGLKCQRIAEVLGVSVKTVQAHRENIKVKLGFKDANTLVCFAARWVETERGTQGEAAQP